MIARLLCKLGSHDFRGPARYDRASRQNVHWCRRRGCWEKRPLAFPEGFGAICGDCGFRYWQFQGRIIPCPRCKAERLEAQLNREQRA